MGVLNVTPDSFSDGGHWFDPAAAVAHGLEMIAAGADVVDVGGESTRPGAEPVDEAEERRRVLPVIEALAAHVPGLGRHPQGGGGRGRGRRPGRRSSTTSRPPCGPSPPTPASGWVAMHMRGDPRTMQRHADYDDVVAEVAPLPGRAGRRGRERPASPRSGSTRASASARPRPQPAAAPAPRRAGGHGVAGGGRHQPQDLPRAPGCAAPDGDAAGAVTTASRARCAIDGRGPWSRVRHGPGPRRAPTGRSAAGRGSSKPRWTA